MPGFQLRARERTLITTALGALIPRLPWRSRREDPKWIRAGIQIDECTVWRMRSVNRDVETSWWLL